MYKHLFGPVPSRRLGMSLGIDLIPHKICTLNCIYCECGATTSLTHERKAYVPVDEVYSELNDFFKNNPDPDYLTFSGAGEPTLHSHIGEVIAFLKELRPSIRVAVLTNGTLFGDPEVREELMLADLVLPSLDAATDLAMRRINRPRRELKASGYIKGLIEFSREFKGEIWLEILRAARNEKADVIVMGPYTDFGPDSGIDVAPHLGSNAQRVSLKARCPVSIITSPKQHQAMEAIEKQKA